ncbi:hypothetical protein TNCV_16391 [Trichonephila clavipes]|nr:hypothetical protein TNCV_16391 [Trichonephila clavipes]
MDKPCLFVMKLIKSSLIVCSLFNESRLNSSCKSIVDDDRHRQWRFLLGVRTVNSPQSHIVRVYDAGHGKSGVFHSAEWHVGDWLSDGIREAWLMFFIWVWYWARTHDMPAMIRYLDHWATAALIQIWTRAIVEEPKNLALRSSDKDDA